MSFEQNLQVKDLENIYLKIYENACELLEEAEILYNHGKFARAHACAQFSMEEFGKLPMIYTTATRVGKGDKINWKYLNKRLRNHKSKTSLAFALIQVVLVSKNYKHSPDNLQDYKMFLDKDFKFDNRIVEIFNSTKEDLIRDYIIRQSIAQVLNKYKNLSLYADFNDNGDFVKPNEIIDQKRCQDRIRAALLMKKIVDIVNLHNTGFSFFDNTTFSSFESLMSYIRRLLY